MAHQKKWLFGLILLLQACMGNIPPHTLPQLNHAQNGAWLSVDWVNEPHSVEEITALAQTLQQQQIRYLFVFTSYLKDYGEFNPTYDYAAGFVKTMQATAPDIKLLAWVGIPVQNPNVAYHTGYVDLADTETRNKIALFSQSLISEAGFDGVHLDPEPISDGDTSLLTLLHETRQAIGADAFLSLATPPILPTSPDAPFPHVSLAVWQAEYYRQMALNVDQMAVMVYDSGTTSPEMYQDFVRFQTIELSQAVEGLDVHLLIGLPTYAEWTATHDPAYENLTTGLSGVVDGLLSPDAVANNVDGVAIYPYWEFDSDAVDVYEKVWLRK